MNARRNIGSAFTFLTTLLNTETVGMISEMSFS